MASTTFSKPVDTEIKALNSNLSKLNSNSNHTEDILSKALNNDISFFTKGRGNDYTGDVPRDIFKYGTFMVNVRDNQRMVLAITPTSEIAINGYDGTSWAGWQELVPKSQIFKEITNGNVTQNHAYIIHMSESTISNAQFEVLYNPYENQGMQSFGIVLDNGINLFLCAGKLTLSNGTLSLSDTYRCASNENRRDAWNVVIRYIRMIA